KFIKIDDASRAVIDRLVASKAGAGSAYTSDPAALEDDAKSAAPPITLRGVQAATQEPSAPPPAAKPVVAPAPTPGPAAAPAAGPAAVPASAARVPPAAPSSAPAAAKTAPPGGRPGFKLDTTIPMGSLAGLPKPGAPAGATQSRPPSVASG